MENKILDNGILMPNIGFGTYPLHGKQLDNVVRMAVESGFRMFDTSHSYDNEDSLGNALQNIYRETSLKREDIIINTKVGEKLYNGFPTCEIFYNNGKKKNIEKIVRNMVSESLAELQTNYIDSLLIHWPYPDSFCEIWKVLEKLYADGVLKSIGVSNFNERHLNKIMSIANVRPMVNQIEVGPLNTKKDLIQFCNTNNIAVQVYSPLQSLNFSQISKNEKLSAIATKYNKDFAQIILKWNIQNGLIPICKSSHKSRIYSNIDIYDFNLTDEEIALFDSLNEDYQYLPKSLYCPGY